MPSFKPIKASIPANSKNHEPQIASTAGCQSGLTQGVDSPTQMDRIAWLVAQGEVVAPENLSEEELDFFMQRVHYYRRQMLVDFIARTIALDFSRSNEP